MKPATGTDALARAALSGMPAFVRRLVVSIAQPAAGPWPWKWKPGVVLAHKGQRRTILACAWNLHGEPVYLIQTGAGRVNLKGARAGDLEYGPVLGQVAGAVSLRRAARQDRAARRSSSRRGAGTLRARRSVDAAPLASNSPAPATRPAP